MMTCNHVAEMQKIKNCAAAFFRTEKVFILFVHMPKERDKTTKKPFGFGAPIQIVVLVENDAQL